MSEHNPTINANTIKERDSKSTEEDAATATVTATATVEATKAPELEEKDKEVREDPMEEQEEEEDLPIPSLPSLPADSRLLQPASVIRVGPQDVVFVPVAAVGGARASLGSEDRSSSYAVLSTDDSFHPGNAFFRRIVFSHIMNRQQLQQQDNNLNNSHSSSTATSLLASLARLIIREIHQMKGRFLLQQQHGRSSSSLRVLPRQHAFRLVTETARQLAAESGEGKKYPQLTVPQVRLVVHPPLSVPQVRFTVETTSRKNPHQETQQQFVNTRVMPMPQSTKNNNDNVDGKLQDYSKIKIPPASSSSNVGATVVAAKAPTTTAAAAPKAPPTIDVTKLQQPPLSNANSSSTSTNKEQITAGTTVATTPATTTAAEKKTKSSHHQRDIFAAAIPPEASSVFRIFGRSVNLDAHDHRDASLYSLLRSWVQDDPFRKIPTGDLMDYDTIRVPKFKREKQHSPPPQQQRQPEENSKKEATSSDDRSTTGSTTSIWTVLGSGPKPSLEELQAEQAARFSRIKRQKQLEFRQRDRHVVQAMRKRGVLLVRK